MGSIFQRVMRLFTFIAIILAILLWILTIIGWLITDPGFEPINVFVTAIMSSLIALWGWLRTRSTKVVSANDNSLNMQPIASQTTSSITGDIHSQFVVTGGQRININTVPQQQLNQYIIHADSLSQQLEYFRQVLDLKHTPTDYERSQFKAYCDIWKVLQVLRDAGDSLWEIASKENILNFALHLRETTSKIRESAIFFDEGDYEQLNRLLKDFGSFRLGKLRLHEIRSQTDIDRYVRLHAAQEQINKNYIIKQQYEELLEKIRVSFKNRLSVSMS